MAVSHWVHLLVHAGNLLNLVWVKLTRHLISVLRVLDLKMILARRIILLEHEVLLLVLILESLLPLHRQL